MSTQLFELSFGGTKQMDLVISPYLVRVDPNARCDYHAGASTHSVEECMSSRDKVQDWIDSKTIMFTPEKNGNHVPE